ncbi:hypothetical protein BJY52DRAFT_1188991 [Lactarius psammicola]|nr:hypothetical protein BJY52DRAFT_1188991 [Lactarius psammicola]
MSTLSPALGSPPPPSASPQGASPPGAPRNSSHLGHLSSGEIREQVEEQVKNIQEVVAKGEIDHLLVSKETVNAQEQIQQEHTEEIELAHQEIRAQISSEKKA